jgi:hypothetical protein
MLANVVYAGHGHGMRNQGSSTSTTVGALTNEEIHDLIWIREEEKLARDLYRAFYTAHQLAIFSNIAQAEERHTTAVQNALLRYQITDPVVTDIQGEFQDQTLQAIYDEQVILGQASALAALQIGALIEELDILDNQAALEQTTEPELQQLYNNLLRGSRNHLRAYVRVIESQGVVYQAQALDQAAVDLIVDTAIERGRNGGFR